MKSYRVYRVYSSQGAHSEVETRENYLFSVVVSDSEADYVVNPAIEPERTLEFFRSRLKKILDMLENQDASPENIEDWSRAATYNLGYYQKFSLVLEINEENEPLADFLVVRDREQGQINDWIDFNVAPMDE